MSNYGETLPCYMRLEMILKLLKKNLCDGDGELGKHPREIDMVNQVMVVIVNISRYTRINLIRSTHLPSDWKESA